MQLKRATTAQEFRLYEDYSFEQPPLKMVTLSIAEKTALVDPRMNDGGSDRFFTLTGRAIHPSEPAYRVRTATLVDPRVTPSVSLKVTLIRFSAGRKGIWSVLSTNTLNVGVSSLLIVVVTKLAGGL